MSQLVYLVTLSYLKTPDIPPGLVDDPPSDTENEENSVNPSIGTEADKDDQQRDDSNVNLDRTLVITGEDGDGSLEQNLANVLNANQDGSIVVSEAGGDAPEANLGSSPSTQTVGILILPTDFDGNAELNGKERFNFATADDLRRAVNGSKDWLDPCLLAALLSNASLFAVDGSKMVELAFKEGGTGKVIVLIDAEYQKEKPKITHKLYTSRINFKLQEHKPRNKEFDGINMTCHDFGGDRWRRKRCTLESNEFHVLQWLSPETGSSTSVAKGKRAKHSLESCIDRLLEIEGLTDAEIASAADIMRSEENRTIFMSLGSKGTAQLIWLRKQLPPA